MEAVLHPTSTSTAYRLTSNQISTAKVRMTIVCSKRRKDRLSSSFPSPWMIFYFSRTILPFLMNFRTALLTNTQSNVFHNIPVSSGKFRMTAVVAYTFHNLQRSALSCSGNILHLPIHFQPRFRKIQILTTNILPQHSKRPFTTTIAERLVSFAISLTVQALTYHSQCLRLLNFPTS